MLACIVVLLSLWADQETIIDVAELEARLGQPKQNAMEIRRTLGDHELVIYLDQPEAGLASLGPHSAHLLVKNCPRPRLWLRWKGFALVPVPLVESMDGRSWSGEFTFPANGEYALQAQWYGCDTNSTASTDLDETLELKAAGTRPTPPPSMFAPGSVWYQSSKLRIEEDIPNLPPYLFVNPAKDVMEGKTRRILSTQESAVAEAGVLVADGYSQFVELSNYELVCFMGSPSMGRLRQAFLDLRPKVEASQRPFKFHFFPTPAFERPDRDWPETEKERLRKCKHILFGLDEYERPISQADFRERLVTFVHHLVKVEDDPTFYVWILSVNVPASTAATTSYCHSPASPQTLAHPCNTVIRDLFANRVWPDQVHFLDNTDVTDALWDEDKAEAWALAVIALRVFVLLGRDVAVWRTSGQIGHENGLHRNGTVEPNQPLIPYNAWN